MGYFKHDAIVVIGYDVNVDKARDKAIELNLPCSEIVKSKTNGFYSFLIAPDGSKEGWGTSNEMDEARNKWKEYASNLDWAHIRFGGDDSDLASFVEWR